MKFAGKKVFVLALCLAFSWLIICCTSDEPALTKMNCSNLSLEGTMTSSQLECYLNRSITMSDLLHDYIYFPVQLSFIEEIRPLFLGRTIFFWGGESAFDIRIPAAQEKIEMIHALDPNIICQAAIFEIVTDKVEQIAIPDWVFSAFDEPYEDRNFNYESMLFPSGYDEIGLWGNNASVPDITNLEVRMWFFFLAASYIDIGIEAIHLGQIEWTSQFDLGNSLLNSLTDKIRDYASLNARRGFVLLDGHSDGMKYIDNLILDNHASPLRLFSDESSPVGISISQDYSDSIYTKSLGGTHPMGHDCQHNLYMVEFDHGYSQGSLELNTGPEFIDGYDEISYLAIQEEETRNDIISYLWNKVKSIDPYGSLEMPGIRALFINMTEYQESWYYAANNKDGFTDGYNQADIIKEIWNSSSVY